MAAEKLCVFNLTRQSFLSLGVGVADTHFARLRGLLGRSRLRSDDGLWVAPCQGVHTIGVLFPIDVVYLDESLRVVHLIEDLPPFRIAPLRMRSSSVLELPPRSVFWSHTQPGDQFLICTPDELADYWNAQPGQHVVEAQPLPDVPASDPGRASPQPPARSQTRFQGWFRRFLYTRRAPRSSRGGVCAYYWNGGSPKPHEALNISESGAYLKTSDRWYPGTIIELRLQRPPQNGNGSEVPQRSVCVLSQVARSDSDGIAVKFMYSRPDQRLKVREFLAAMSSGKQELEQPPRKTAAAGGGG